MAAEDIKENGGELQVQSTDTVSVRPVLRRNPTAPIYYSPVLDVRLTDRDVRLLSFIIPPADPEDVILKDDEYLLPIQSQCELIVPIETVGPLIEVLQAQYQTFIERTQKRQSEG